MTLDPQEYRATRTQTTEEEASMAQRAGGNGLEADEEANPLSDCEHGYDLDMVRNHCPTCNKIEARAAIVMGTSRGDIQRITLDDCGGHEHQKGKGIITNPPNDGRGRGHAAPVRSTRRRNHKRKCGSGRNIKRPTKEATPTARTRGRRGSDGAATDEGSAEEDDSAEPEPRHRVTNRHGAAATPVALSAHLSVHACVDEYRGPIESLSREMATREAQMRQQTKLQAGAWRKRKHMEEEQARKLLYIAKELARSERPGETNLSDEQVRHDLEQLASVAKLEALPFEEHLENNHHRAGEFEENANVAQSLRPLGRIERVELMTENKSAASARDPALSSLAFGDAAGLGPWPQGGPDGADQGGNEESDSFGEEEPGLGSDALTHGRAGTPLQRALDNLRPAGPGQRRQRYQRLPANYGQKRTRASDPRQEAEVPPGEASPARQGAPTPPRGDARGRRRTSPTRTTNI